MHELTGADGAPATCSATRERRPSCFSTVKRPTAPQLTPALSLPPSVPSQYAYKRYWFRPRILRPVEAIQMDTALLGGRVRTSVPIYISPAVRPASPLSASARPRAPAGRLTTGSLCRFGVRQAQARWAHPEGERNLVKAASAGGVVHGVSPPPPICALTSLPKPSQAPGRKKLTSPLSRTGSRR